jgi:4-hydroxy-2-oxoheptanedioate aldolase
MSTDSCKSGEEFKKDLLAGKPKFGIFLNSASPIIASQLSYSGYDWLLIDTQHGPMDYVTQSGMINAIKLGHSKCMVRVASWNDRAGIQQALDMGADGILIPYVNTRAELDQALTVCFYPTQGTRSVYFPQGSMNSTGLLGYAGTISRNIIVAVQVETASCIKNIDEIIKAPGLDIAFLGPNDLCLSMGLFEKYKFPDMYTSPEFFGAMDKMLAACRKHSKIPGAFLFGADRVGEFMQKGFNFLSVGNDLHHVLTQSGAYAKSLEEITKNAGRPWNHQPTKLF